MKRRLARTVLKASVLVLSSSRQEAILVKPKKRGREWELPGGKIDPGESLPAGASREVFEETGTRVELESMVALYKCLRQHELMFLFLGRWLEGDLQPDTAEIAAACWEPLATAAAKIQSPLHRQRVHDCLSFRGSPLFRLIRKRPFRIIESWELGTASLLGSACSRQGWFLEQVPALRPPALARLPWWRRLDRREGTETVS